MIVLGIDTALRTTGYGLIRLDQGRFTVLDCGVIANKPALKHAECLRRIFLGIRELIENYHPDAASIEAAFANKNIRTTMLLSMARGAASASAAVCGVPVFEYSPKTAKRAAVGMGTAAKEQVASVLAAMCSLEVSRIPNDATDALALAVCHANIATRPELSHLAKEL